MSHNKETRNKAFQLYASGIPKERIAKTLGINKLTLYRWIDKYKWQPTKAEIDQKVTELLNESVTELKERQLRIIRASISRYAEQLREKQVDVKPSDIIAMLKHELHLRGEAETSFTNKAQEDLVKLMTEWIKEDTEKKDDVELDEKKEDI